MRFGGHETFPVREGWLNKGVRMLVEHPERFEDEFVADWLGVGKNMARSIRHWLIATGLTLTPKGFSRYRGARLEPTELAKTIWAHDPYFLEPGTWWALHINLVNEAQHAASWKWLFNSFHQSRFERAVCYENLRRHLSLTVKRVPSEKTLGRDLACLLACYARKIPAQNDDPEDGRDCPFIELGLLSYFRSSGYYEWNLGPKDVPPEILGYAIATAFPDAAQGDGAVDITVHQAAQQVGGPGRAFVLTPESLFETVLRCEGRSHGPGIEIAGLGGERVVRLPRRSPIDWLMSYYEALSERSRDVA